MMTRSDLFAAGYRPGLTMPADAHVIENMRCPKCQGFLQPERWHNPWPGTHDLKMFTRCLSCGYRRPY